MMWHGGWWHENKSVPFVFCFDGTYAYLTDPATLLTTNGDVNPIDIPLWDAANDNDYQPLLERTVA